jgi:type I restriction enzyme, S subunit
MDTWATTTAQPTLNLADVTRLPIVLPPDWERRAIQELLTALDDKIDLNRRVNDTLECMARAIFKSWFVDFDPVRAKAEGRQPAGMNAETAALFSSEFTESEIGHIPSHWTVSTIDSIADRVAMGPFGSSIAVSTFVDDGVPIISGQHLTGLMMSDTSFRYITPEHAFRLRNAVVKRADVIFTHAGNIGQVAYIPAGSRFEQYVISQRQFYMRCKTERVSPEFVTHYFHSPEGQFRLLANSSSSGVPSIARPVTYLRSIKLVVPTKPVIDAFTAIVRPLHTLSRSNHDQNTVLTALRDTLLPKLLSGEVRIREAEKAVEAHV